jgi:hypothetical protein
MMVRERAEAISGGWRFRHPCSIRSKSEYGAASRANDSVSG